jgi:hypothetical protein
MNINSKGSLSRSMSEHMFGNPVQCPLGKLVVCRKILHNAWCNSFFLFVTLTLAHSYQNCLG